jgi:hypothetical protein
MKSLVSYLDCGQIYSSSAEGEAVNFTVERFSDITDKIIPFFDKYPIEGVKAFDFADFKRVAELMKNKAHLTADGLEVILKLKAGMNRGR